MRIADKHQRAEYIIGCSKGDKLLSKRVAAYMFIVLLFFTYWSPEGVSAAGLGDPAEIGTPFVIEEELPVNQPKDDIGMPIGTKQTIDAAFGMEDGVNVMYTTVTGSPTAGQSASFNVVDIDNQRLLGVYPLTGTANAWTHVKAGNGKVYIGASNKVFVYSPDTKTIEDLGVPIGGTGAIYSLVSDEDNNIYGGVYSTSSGGRVFKIDAETNSITDVLGKPVDDGTGAGDDGKKEDYVRSLAYHDGHLYAGTGSTNGRVWKINPETKENKVLTLPGQASDPIYAGKYNNMGLVYGMTVVDHYLFAFFNGPFAMLVYDMEKEEWREGGISNVRGLLAVTPSHDGEVYTSKRDGYMWKINVETLNEEKAFAFDGSVRSSAWMNIKNQPDFPGTSLVTVSFDGKVVLYNPVTGQRTALESVVEKQANNIQALEAAPNNELYMSSYMGTLGAHYDPQTSKFTNFNLGQAEGIGFLEDKAYFGLYPKAEIRSWNLAVPPTETTTPGKLFSIGESQDRPFVVTNGGGRLLIGTIPEYSMQGGAITVYDPATGDVQVTRNVIENQSITGLLHHEGLVYGSTSIHGGLGDQPAEEKAKLFVWDMNTKEVLHEWEPGLSGTSGEMISGLTLGKDGLIYASMDGYVFAFDPETRETVKSVNAYPEVKAYGRWRPVHQHWGSDGLLYSDVAGKLTAINTEKMESKKLLDGIALFTIADQERIYTATGPTVSRYEAVKPVQLTVETASSLEIGESAEVKVKGDLLDWTLDLTGVAELAVSDPDVLKWEGGKLIALKKGTVQVMAAYRGVTSMPVTVKVTDGEPELKNGDFEEKEEEGIVPGWTLNRFREGSSKVELSMSIVKKGKQSLKITDGSDRPKEYTSVQSDLFEVKPGKKYRTKGQIYLGNPPMNNHPGKPYRVSDAAIKVRFHDKEGKELKVKGNMEKTIRNPQEKWQSFDISLNAPADAKYMSIILAAGEQKLAVVHFDDLHVLENE